MAYFTKLKNFWDELSYLRPSPSCNCNVIALRNEIDNTDNLIQFLIGLNDSYDNMRNQLLIIKPLPIVNKPYSMVLSVEKQREEQINNVTEEMPAVFYTNPKDSSRPHNRGKDKDNRICTYCKNTGHTRETCFKLHGYPEWFTELKGRKGKERVNVVSDEISSNIKGKTPVSTS